MVKATQIVTVSEANTLPQTSLELSTKTYFNLICHLRLELLELETLELGRKGSFNVQTLFLNDSSFSRVITTYIHYEIIFIAHVHQLQFAVLVLINLRSFTNIAIQWNGWNT